MIMNVGKYIPCFMDPMGNASLWCFHRPSCWSQQFEAASVTFALREKAESFGLLWLGYFDSRILKGGGVFKGSG